MKLVQLFDQPLGRNSLLAGIVLSLFFITACTSETPELAGATPQGDLVYPCNPTDSVDFPLDAYTFETGNLDMAVDLETGSYQLSDCMCKIEGFQYVFDGVAPDCNILVITADGDTLDSTQVEISINEFGVATVLLPNPEILTDDRLTVYFVFDAEGDDPKPTLVHAGGLCIIENVVGTVAWNTQTLQTPYVLTQTDVNGNTLKKIFIPTAIGGMSY